MNSEVFDWAQKLPGPKIISGYNSPFLYAQKYFFYRAGFAGNDIKFEVFKSPLKARCSGLLNSVIKPGTLF